MGIFGFTCGVGNMCGGSNEEAEVVLGDNPSAELNFFEDTEEHSSSVDYSGSYNSDVFSASKFIFIDCDSKLVNAHSSNTVDLQSKELIKGESIMSLTPTRALSQSNKWAFHIERTKKLLLDVIRLEKKD